MGAPDVFFEALKEELLVAINKHDYKRIDDILDLWFDAKYRATEYDAKVWGFNPERWMMEERDILALRASPDFQKKQRRKT